ncbi:hypothetical protein [Allosphingosinicella indica]|uniref:Selenocysteine lyase/Cysteine desulfurase n=1 Tax=Allosphingosinicella indica TaxID=941907 RepID=A0A1X7G247_9SPHN|nr:hypothetical protein [Allosphingosinicella indica]SMF62643.1 Selenocysteine lyase/Cysteine desulfurase [Allosphingosinicella indica]
MIDVSNMMSRGGDARIVMDPASGLNRYFSAPRPSRLTAYASSTANDISADAFAHVRAAAERLAPDGELAAEAYAAALAGMAGRIRRAYGVDDDTDVVFAPSGTDLEYVTLAAALGRAPGGIHNILLGADEVGSGCIHSAFGRYFADETALGAAVSPGDPVPGLDGVTLEDVAVRDASGAARSSVDIAAALDAAIGRAKAAGRHALVHVVHGSKTGLIVPTLADVDALAARHGDAMRLVVDACQARITGGAVRDYLARGGIVFVTGSKFMGGPPFSGFALVPRAARPVTRLPEGFATIFRRAEWPAGWPGRETLVEGVNLGLLLRLEASVFELERFQALDPAAVRRAILAFHNAVRRHMVDGLGARRVAPYPPGDRAVADAHPIEMRTLSTLDFSRGGATFEDAQRWHRAMVDQGVRVGQPVKCVPLAGGGWGATLRIGLAMPQLVRFAAMEKAALREALDADMAKIAAALQAVRAPAGRPLTAVTSP